MKGIGPEYKRTLHFADDNKTILNSTQQDKNNRNNHSELPRLRTSHMDASSRRVTYSCSNPKLHLVPSTCTVTWRLLSPRTQNDLLVHTYQAGGGKWNRITILTGARQHLYRYCSGEEGKHLVVQKPQMRKKKSYNFLLQVH